MADEVSTIGIGVDTSGVVKGYTALDTLAEKGASAEKSLKNLGGTGAASGLDAAAKAAGGASSEFDRMGSAAGSASKQSSGLALSIGSIVGAGAGLSAVTASINAISGALTKLPRDAFNYAKDIEVSAVGMAGIIGSVSTLNGEQVKYNQALGISQSMIQKLNDDALRTAASSKELVTTFQALLAPGLAAGMGLEQIRELTTVGANAVKSMGLGANQLVQELRDLVAGGITASSSTLATALGLKDADIAKAKASSEGLFVFLMDKLKGFEQSSEAFGDTLQGKIDQLQEGALRVAADGMQPLTVAIGDAAKELSGLFVQVDDSKNVQINPQLVSSLQDISGNIVAISGAVKGGLQGLWEYRDAVTLVVGAWAAFKIGGIAADIAAAGTATLARAEASRFAAIQSAAESAGNEAVTLTSTQKAAAYLNELRANVARTAAQVAATSGTVAATAAERAHALAVTQLESAQIAASRSAGAFSLAMSAMGGTVGLAVTAIAGLYMAYRSATSGANDAAAAAIKYKRAIDQSSQGKAVDQRDLSAMQEYVDRLKETRDASLLAGDALRTYRDATGELTTGKASTLGMTIANAEADLERAKLATQTATTANVTLEQTAAAAKAAWMKNGDHIKTAIGITDDYKEKLGKLNADYKKFIDLTQKRSDMTPEEKKSELKAGEERQLQMVEALDKARDKALKNLTASEDKAAGMAAKRQQREDNELAQLKARLESTKSLGDQLRAQLESTGTGKPATQTEGEREAAKWTAEANVQRDQKVKALMLEKAALAQQRGEQEKANKAMEDAISAAKRENDAISGRIDSLTKEAQNQEAANLVYGKGTGAIEAMNLARAQEAVAIAMSFGESDRRIALLQEEADLIGRVNAANAEGRFKKAGEDLDKGIAAAREQASLYADELRLTGMTALERAKITAEKQAQVKLAKDLDDIEKSGFSDAEKALLRGKAQEKFEIERSAAVNKVIQDDFAKTSDQINQSLTDALVRGFEGGKDAAKNMRDVIVNMFKTMVLRPAISAVLSPVGGAISSAIGGSSGGGISSGIQTASNLNSLWGTASQAMYGATAGATTASLIGANAVGMAGGDALGTLIAANGAWAGVATRAQAAAQAAVAANVALEAGTAVALEAGTLATAGGAAGAATAGAASSLTSAIAAIPGWGWALAGAALLAGSGAFNGGETRAGSRLETTATGTRYAEGPSGGRINAALEDKITKSAYDGINKILQNLGSKEVLGKFVSGLETSTKGRGGVFAGGTLSSGAVFGDVQSAAAYKFTQDLKPEDAIKAYAAELTKATVEALSAATDLPKYAQRVLSGIDLKKMTVDEAAQALQVISEYPKKLLELAGTSRDALVEQFTSGLMDKTVSAQKAGQNVALSLVSSIEQTVMTAGAGQIFDTVNVGIITPMLDALATGASVSEALSKSSIDAVVQKATEQAQALNALFTNVDFKAALDQIKTTVGTALGSAGAAMNYQPTYWNPDASKSKEQSAAEKAAEDLAKRIKDTLDGLKTDGLSLQIELLRAQGNDAAAALMELNKATEGWDAASRELYRQRLADNTALKEQIRAQNSLNSLRDAGVELEIKALRTIGREEAAVALERDIAIKGISRLEVVQYDANKGLEKQIAALESLANLRSEGASLSINVLAALGQNERALSMQREIAVKGMTALEVAQYDANRSLEKLIDGIGKFKTAFDSAKSSLSLGGVPTAGSISTAGLTQSAALEANAKNLRIYLSARDADYAALIKDIAKPVVGDISIASYLGLPTDTKGLQSLSAPTIGKMMDKVGSLAANLAETDPSAFNQWGKFLENVASGLGLLNGYNQEYAKTTQTLTETEISLGETRKEEAKKLSAFAAELASAKSQADIALLKAQGKTEQAAALERESYIAGLVDLTAEQVAAKVGAYDYTKTIERQVAVMQQRQGLEQSLAQALGDTVALRQKELAALDASNRPLQERLYAIADAGAALDAAMSGVQRAVDAEKTSVTKKATAQIDSIKAEIDARTKATETAKTQIGTLSEIFTSITDAVKNLRGSVNQEIGLMQARSYIDMSISLAKAGAMPDSSKLKDAIAAVTKDAASSYVSNAEFEYAQLVQAGKLDEVGVLVGAQKSVQELQLDAIEQANKLATEQISAIEKSRDDQLSALDAQLKAAQDQVSVMKGVDISIKSVADAVAQLSAALAASSALKQKDTGAVFQQAEVGFLPAKIPSESFTLGQPMAAASAPAVDRNPNAVIDKISAVTGMARNEVANQPATVGELYAWAKDLNIPGFAAGANYIPQDMLARIHEGEAIIPKPFNPWANGGQFGVSSAATEQAIYTLISRVEELESLLRESNGIQTETRDLVDNVTDGGNMMRANILKTV